MLPRLQYNCVWHLVYVLLKQALCLALKKKKNSELDEKQFWKQRKRENRQNPSGIIINIYWTLIVPQGLYNYHASLYSQNILIKYTLSLSPFHRWKYTGTEDLYDLREPGLPAGNPIPKTVYQLTILYSFSTCLSLLPTSRYPQRQALTSLSISSTQHKAWHVVRISKYLSDQVNQKLPGKHEL